MKKTLILFLILCFLYLVNAEIPKYLLNTDELIYNSLSEKLDRDQVVEIIKLQQKWAWVGYFLIPVFIIIKSILIVSVLYIGLAFTSARIRVMQIWAIVIKAEFIFLLVPIFKIIWFYFFETNYTIEDIQNFYPLSALNIVGYKGLEPWFIYPFQTLNLFELAYWLLLAYYIGKITETNMDNGLKIVACSYGSALLLWVVTIMFFTLNYS